MATTNDLKNGMVLQLDNGLWAVNEFQHVKPGKGGAFDQLYIPEQTLGTVKDYILENMEAMVAMHDGAALYVELPASVELIVSHTDPGLQGDRSTGGTKPATLETGAEIQVPLFLTTGEKIKVDTRDGRYLGRVSEK
jgi:elongation factor P